MKRFLGRRRDEELEAREAEHQAELRRQRENLASEIEAQRLHFIEMEEQRENERLKAEEKRNEERRQQEREQQARMQHLWHQQQEQQKAWELEQKMQKEHEESQKKKDAEERERLRKQKARERIRRNAENKKQNDPKSLKDLRELIRTRYELDIDIWSKKNVKSADKSLVQVKMEKSDAILRQIQAIVSSWERDSGNWTPEEWKLAEEVKTRLTKKGKREWMKNPSRNG